MISKREFLYWKEVEKEDGTIARFSVYKKGHNFFIKNDQGYEHLMHPTARSVDDEIRIVFRAKPLREIMPWEQS